MPIYEFECPIHGRFEKILPLKPYGDIASIPCTINLDCNLRAEKLVSTFSLCMEAAPTIIFRNPKTGEAQVATSRYDKPPVGFIKDELKTPIERSRFEREETLKANVEAQIETHVIKEKSNALRKIRQDDIRATMNAKQVDIHPDTGEKIEYHMDHNTKALLEKAMKRSAAKDRIPTKRVEKRLAVNHTDSSNLIDVPK